MTKIKILCVAWLPAICLVCSCGQTAQKSAEGKPSSEIERLREKLTRYVAEGKVFDRNKITDFDTPSEFGQFNGFTCEGSNYSLIISFEGNSQIRILDFILEEKGKLYASGQSYSGCAVFKNWKKVNGIYNGDAACEEVSAVKLTFANTRCRIEIPIEKAWKKDENGKFIEVDARRLVWYEECP
ncbi:MAG: hypothetical protein LBL07_07075 [Tannerella sp.]|jgi:hypothetical protein|nr:hypothetical protein [Tannerella sp.]